MLTFVLIKKFFINLLCLLQIFQTLKRLPVCQIIFDILPVHRLKQVENHWVNKFRKKYHAQAILWVTVYKASMCVATKIKCNVHSIELQNRPGSVLAPANHLSLQDAEALRNEDSFLQNFTK